MAGAQRALPRVSEGAQPCQHPVSESRPQDCAVAPVPATWADTVSARPPSRTPRTAGFAPSRTGLGAQAHTCFFQAPNDSGKRGEHPELKGKC